MLKRTLTLGLALGLAGLGALGCSSSSNPPSGKKDGGGDATEAGGDAAATEGGGDSSADVALDGGASDAPVDGVVLTALQARGEYLVDHVIACPDCHTPMKADGSPDLTKYLAGNASFISLPNGDKLPTRNLTNDATGLKNRTDDQIKAMFLDGKRPTTTGTEALNPVMPYYVFHNMKAEDADAIVAYLRTVKAVVNDIPRRAAAFDVTAPVNNIDPNTIPLPLATFADRESALRGRYLAAESGVCIECHTQHQMAADVLDPTKFFQGGEDFSSLFAATLMIHPVSKNLTSDTATGLGTWTVAEIVNALKNGKSKDGTGICPPMPFGPMGAYGGLHDADALDIANYIKSLPPVAHAIVDMCVFSPGGPPADGGTDAAEAGLSEAGSDTAGDTAASGDATGG